MVQVSIIPVADTMVAAEVAITAAVEAAIMAGADITITDADNLNVITQWPSGPGFQSGD